jgi:hypothetical protein
MEYIIPLIPHLNHTIAVQRSKIDKKYLDGMDDL